MNFINIHTHFVTNHSFNSILNTFPEDKIIENNYFSVGIHPWFIEVEKLEFHLSLIEEKLQHKNCLALGECGLDKFSKSSIEKQTEVFSNQLLIAEKYSKPVIIHCVKAYQEVINLYKKLKLTIPFIFHGFNRNRQILDLILKENHYISIGTSVLLSENLQNFLKFIPKEKLFLETDNDEFHSIEEVYQSVVKNKGIELADLKIQMIENFKFVFNLKH